MKQNLNTGTGTPYLAIFDANETPIVDLLYNVPIGVFVTKFRYTYVEDGPDKAEITIETGNVNISDHPSLQYLMPVKLQWGWLYPDGKINSGPVRSLIIKDYKLSFSIDGVNMTIELSDSTFLLKKDPSDYSSTSSSLDKQGDMVEYVKQVLKGTGQRIEVIKFEAKEK